MKFLGLRLGLIVTTLIALLGYWRGNLEQGIVWAGTVGMVCFVLAFIFMGSLGSGDRVRANYYNSSPEEIRIRQNWGWLFFRTGLPGFLLAVIYYWDKV